MGFPTAGFGSGWDQFTPTGEIEFALKNFYLPGMEEQKNNARVLLAVLERNEKDVSGDFAYVPVLLGRNWGIGMRANRQKLPDPGSQVGTKAQVPMRYAFGRLLVTLHAMTATKNSQGSYDTVVDVETEGLMEDLPKDINRQLFLDGTGRIGEVASLSSDTITIDNSVMVAPLNANELTKYFEVGQRIDIYTAGTRDDEGIIVEVVDSANEVTFTTTPSGATNGDLCYISGNKDIEVTGLLAVVSATGTYQNINRATAGNERWKANVVTGAGDVTEADMQQIYTACQKASGYSPNLIVGTYEFRDRYASILQSDRRFVNTLEYKGGFKGPEFQGIGVVPDTECPRGKTFFLNTNYLSIYQQAGLQFMDEDGAILARVPDYAAYEATLYWFFELGARRCNVHGLMSGFNQ
jgi:hypothetical protein